jgi:hypothetical protein
MQNAPLAVVHCALASLRFSKEPNFADVECKSCDTSEAARKNEERVSGTAAGEECPVMLATADGEVNAADGDEAPLVARSARNSLVLSTAILFYRRHRS